MSQATESRSGAAGLRGYRWAMLGGVALLYACFGLTVASLAPLVDTIVSDLGISHSAMGSVLGAWQLVYIAAAIPCGALLDRFGPRLVLTAGAVLIAASGLLRAGAESHLSMFLAVGIFGLGGPLVSIGAPKVVAVWFEGKERGLGMGLYMTGMAAGSIAALTLTNDVMMPLMGGDWRAVLTVYALVALGAGAVWLALASHPVARAVERHQALDVPRPQLEVFRQMLGLPAVRILLAMSIFIFVFNHGLNNWLPEILRSRGMTPAEAGYWAAIPTAVGLLAALTIPRLAIPARRMRILLLVFLGVLAASLLLQLGPGPGLAAGLVLQGIGAGSMMTLAILVLVEIPEIGSRYAGLATGLFFAAAEIGGVLGPLTLGVIYDATGGFSAALLLLTANCTLLLALLALLRRHHSP